MSPRLDEARCCPSWPALFLRRSACYRCQHGHGDDLRRLLRGYAVVRKRPPDIEVRERDRLVDDASAPANPPHCLAHELGVLLRVLPHPASQRRDAILLAARDFDLACTAFVHREALAHQNSYALRKRLDAR